jgi:hypothetical protein
MKKSFSIQELLHHKVQMSSNHHTHALPPHRELFKNYQEHNLKHRGSSHNYKTKQNKLPS